MRVTVLYFAWLRERIGEPREEVDTSAATVADLVAELAARSEGHALAFADLAPEVLDGVDPQLLVQYDQAIADCAKAESAMKLFM